MSSQITTWRNWIAVTALGVGSFTIVTTELAPIAVLSGMADDLGLPISTVGLIVTLYSWIAVPAGLLTPVALSRVPRRPLLVALMLILALSSGISAMAGAFPALMGARIIGALSQGVFWAIIGTLGVQLVPPHRVGLATAIIFGGVSTASALGVPLANLIGTIEGWRSVFACVAVLAIVVAAVCFISLPKLPAARERVRISAMRRVVSNPRFLRIYVATALVITGHFMAFTYIEPYLGMQSGITPSAIALLLFAFGGAGLVAAVMSGSLIDRRLKSALLTALCLASAAMWLLSMQSDVLGLASTTLVLIFWGGAIAVIMTALQTWILKEAGDETLPAAAIHVSIFNAAIGLGAILGALVLTLASLSQIFLVAAAATVVGTLIIVLSIPPITVSKPTQEAGHAVS